MTVSYPPGRSPQELARKLSAMAARSQDMTPAMKVGAEAIKRLITMTFSSQASPVGAKWKPLSEKTIARRRKGSSTALVDTGVLRNSVATSSGPRTILFGTNVPYAGFQQFGTKRIPARPFMPITRSGQLMDDNAPAKVVFDRIWRAVGSYIVNGKVR